MGVLIRGGGQKEDLLYWRRKSHQDELVVKKKMCKVIEYNENVQVTENL